MSIYFESDVPVLENAAIMVDVCRSELIRRGLFEGARKLRGLEVTGPSSALVALLTVDSIPETPATADIRRHALSALRLAAVGSPVALTEENPRKVSA